MKKKRLKKVDTIEKLAQLMAEGFADVEIGFEAVDRRFDAVDRRFNTVDRRLDAIERRLATIEADAKEIKRTIDRIDTRIAALELAVFGATRSDGGRLSAQSLFARLSKLEKAVFQK